VGDAERDVQAARAAGMTSLVAEFGYLGTADQPDTWGADGAVASMTDLGRWLGLDISASLDAAPPRLAAR
jgi:phosphoglycolate phosphatase